ncbi:hypothetical protein [Symbiopectobacterium sp. RP]
MSESNKPSEESKPQTAPKPTPQPAERNLRTSYTFVADSAENIRKKGK